MDDTDPLSFYLLSITTTDFGIGFWISVVVLVLLLVSSALISGSEAAFFSLSPEEREGVDVGNEPYTETASQLLRQPKDLLAIILDRKSTRLNSSHVRISYAVFCLKKKKKKNKELYN